MDLYNVGRYMDAQKNGNIERYEHTFVGELMQRWTDPSIDMMEWIKMHIQL